jgi:hypothetical protein
LYGENRNNLTAVFIIHHSSFIIHFPTSLTFSKIYTKSSREDLRKGPPLNYLSQTASPFLRLNGSILNIYQPHWEQNDSFYFA